MMRHPLEALPDDATKRRIRREADEQEADFCTKVAALGVTLDELPEERQLLLFDLAPRIWPS